MLDQGKNFCLMKLKTMFMTSDKHVSKIMPTQTPAVLNNEPAFKM